MLGLDFLDHGGASCTLNCGSVFRSLMIKDGRTKTATDSKQGPCSRGLSLAAERAG